MKNKFNRAALVFALAALALTFSAANAIAQKKKTANAPATKIAPVKTETTPEISPPITVAPVAPQVSNKTKICVAAPKTNLAPNETAAASLQNLFVKYLSGPAAEIAPLDALVAVQQQAEAIQKNCRFYLAAVVIQKKSGGGENLGGFLKKGSSVAPLLDNPGTGKTGQTMNKISCTSQTKMATAGDFAAGIKAKDEVTLEYTLFATSGNTAAASGKFKAKANKDGEDILSGLLEQSVNDILTAAMKK